MVNKFKKFLNEYSINLLLPVYNLKSDWEKKNDLLIKGFVPKTIEPQCLIGVPLPRGKAPDKKIQTATEIYFEKEVLPKAKKIIKRHERSYLDIESELK